MNDSCDSNACKINAFSMQRFTRIPLHFSFVYFTYEGCSNMNASSFITFFTYMLRQNGKRFCKGLYVTLKLAPDLKKNTVYLSSYSPLNKGQVRILTLNALNIYQ